MLYARSLNLLLDWTNLASEMALCVPLLLSLLCFFVFYMIVSCYHTCVYVWCF